MKRTREMKNAKSRHYAAALVCFLAVMACGEGTEVGNGLNPFVPRDDEKPNHGSAPAKDESKESPTSMPDDAGAPSRGESMSTGDFAEAMEFILAGCASPLSEITAGTYTAGAETSFTMSGGTLTTSLAQTYQIATVNGADYAVTVSGDAAADLPANYACGTVKSESGLVDGNRTGVTERTVTISHARGEAVVHWFAVASEPSIYKIKVDMSGNVVEFVKQAAATTLKGRDAISPFSRGKN